MGPFRSADAMNAIVSTCDLFSANSWFSNVGTQACIRLPATDSNNPGGFDINMNRLVCEGGDRVILFDGQNSNAPERPGNHVLENMLLVWGWSTYSTKIALGGTTLRNTLMIKPVITNTTSGIRFFDFSVDSPQSGNQSARMDVHNNTILNMSSQAGITPFHDLTGFTNYTEENNVIHEPTVGNTPAAPIGLSTNVPDVTPRNRGRRLSCERFDTSIGTVTSGGSFTVRYPAGTSASDFAGSSRNGVRVNGVTYLQHRGQCSLSFGGSNITVTNTSGVTWSGTARVGFHQTSLSTDASYGSPTSLPLPVPASGSNAIANEGGLLAYHRFDQTTRTGTPWKGAV